MFPVDYLLAAALLSAPPCAEDPPGSADLYAGLAPTMQQLAVAWELLDVNPIANVKRLRVDASPAPRFLSADEEARLRRALDDREERNRRERDSANAWRNMASKWAGRPSPSLAMRNGN